jgi:hypothetical protein
MPPYIHKPSKEVVAASKRAAIREALLELLIKEKKEKITIKCGLRVLDQILLMPECMRTMDEAFLEIKCMRTMDEAFLEIAGCVIQVKRDFELDPWKVVYEDEVIFS